jgi:hypothetical protein
MFSATAKVSVGSKRTNVDRPFDYLARTPSGHVYLLLDRESRDPVVSDEQAGSALFPVGGISTLKAFLSTGGT